MTPGTEKGTTFIKTFSHHAVPVLAAGLGNRSPPWREPRFPASETGTPWREPPTPRREPMRVSNAKYSLWGELNLLHENCLNFT